MILLQRISWSIIDERKNSDILEFKAVFSLGPNFPEDPETKVEDILEIIKNLP